MNNLQQLKWDTRYRDRPVEIQPCGVLREHAGILPAGGRALEVACGLGGNALFLASHGLDCEALDYSAVALDKLQAFADNHQLPVATRRVDLETDYTLPAATYDVIVVSYFLSRPLLPAIARALRPGGLLFYQTFNRSRTACGGPQNPDFLLRAGELPATMPALAVIFSSEDFYGRASTPAETAVILQAAGHR